MNQPIIIRDLGLQPYRSVWHDMQRFTLQRTESSPDELWLVEHPAVYTLGMNADRAHVLHTNNIEIIETDRGGEVTYHGPGQLVLYPLIDINRLNIGVKQLVNQLEQLIIDYLQDFKITAERRPNAPGVYVADAKIAALGLRVKRGRSYHGLSFNINMELMPFSGINPCGYENLAVTQFADCLATAPPPELSRIKAELVKHFCRLLGYNHAVNSAPVS